MCHELKRIRIESEQKSLLIFLQKKEVRFNQLYSGFLLHFHISGIYIYILKFKQKLVCGRPWDWGSPRR